MLQLVVYLVVDFGLTFSGSFLRTFLLTFVLTRVLGVTDVDSDHGGGVSEAKLPKIVELSQRSLAASSGPGGRRTRGFQVHWDSLDTCEPTPRMAPTYIPSMRQARENNAAMPAVSCALEREI